MNFFIHILAMSRVGCEENIFVLPSLCSKLTEMNQNLTCTHIFRNRGKRGDRLDYRGPYAAIAELGRMALLIQEAAGAILTSGCNTEFDLCTIYYDDKLHEISDSLVMGLNGAPGDMIQFVQFIRQNILLYKMRNGYELDTVAIVHFTRKTLADGLKTGNPCLVNMLLAGFDEREGGLLYSLDFLAACVKVPFACHGFGGLFCLSILDRFYKPTLTESEAYEILKMCVLEIHRRLFLNLPNFQVKVISARGVKSLPRITPASFVSNN